mmetsp:Transcript_4367/g.7824  ORF Transcript_4367/g.7824 Transcript_4367/m.7824 type:complete len:268 (-) Transcript_4367:268-1071(-)
MRSHHLTRSIVSALRPLTKNGNPLTAASTKMIGNNSCWSTGCQWRCSQSTSAFHSSTLRPVSNQSVHVGGQNQGTAAWWNVSRPKNSFCQEVVTTKTKTSPARFFTSTTKDSKGEVDESVATTSLSDVTSDDLDLVQEAVKESADFLSGIPGTKQGGGKKLAIVFTCTVCQTRSAKRFTEQAYRNGVVLVRCPGCENQHLIADRLGFFEDKVDGGWDIEKGMAEMGDRVTAVTEDNVLELTLTDIIGKDRAAELEKSGQQDPETETK